MNAPTKIRPDLFVLGGIWTSFAAAIIASWAGWNGLAEQAGWVQTAHIHHPWGGLDVHLSWVFGIAVDWFAASSGRIWLTAWWASPKTRQSAKVWTIVSVVMSALAGATFLIVHWFKAPPFLAVVIIIGFVPSFMAWVSIHVAVRYLDDRRQARAGGTIEGLVRREPLLLRAIGTARTVRNAVQEFRNEVIPAGQESRGVSPAQPATRVALKKAPRRAQLEVVGGSTKSQMKEYYREQRAAGWPDTDGAPLTGAALDRMFGGKTLGRLAIREVEKEDEPEELSS